MAKIKTKITIETVFKERVCGAEGLFCSVRRGSDDKIEILKGLKCISVLHKRR